MSKIRFFLGLVVLLAAGVQPAYGGWWSKVKKSASKAASSVTKTVSNAASSVKTTASNTYNSAAKSVSSTANSVAKSASSAYNSLFGSSSSSSSKPPAGYQPKDPKIQPYASAAILQKIAESAYHHGKEHKFLRQQGVRKYKVMASERFSGDSFISGWSSSASLFRQKWNMVLVRDDRRPTPGYIVAFEGTTSAGDWVGNLITASVDLPDALMKKMRNRLKDDWMPRFNIKPEQIDTFVGHSAGCVFAKHMVPTNELWKYGDPWKVCFNGYDPKNSFGAREIDIRTPGDVVSICAGGKKPITVCTVQDGMGMIDAHALKNIDLKDATWGLIDPDGRYQFASTKEELQQSEAFKRCNAQSVKSSNRIGGVTTAVQTLCRL